MTNNEKKFYPMMAVGNWFTLRKKFKISIPKEVTANYLASVLGMSTLSAQKNILPYLRSTGLIDQDGKTTDRAIKWRDDSQYRQVCEIIRAEIYPQELLDLAPQNDIDRNVVQTWFANNTGSGVSQVNKQTSFYIMLSEGDFSKENETLSTSSPKTKLKSAKTNPIRKAGQPQPIINDDKSTGNFTEPTIPLSVGSKKHDSTEITPQVHFNIQVVIPEKASPETYDMIFKSIAKHLLHRDNG